MADVRTRAELRPRKPFLFVTTAPVVPFAFYNTVASEFVNGSSAGNYEEIATKYPLIRITKVRAILLTPNIRMYDQFIDVQCSFDGTEINGCPNNVRIGGSVKGHNLMVNCDLVMSPRLLPSMGVSFDVISYAIDDYLSFAGISPTIPPEFSLCLEISGEYIDI